MPAGITIIITIIILAILILIFITIFTVIKSRSILTLLSPLPALGFTLDKSALSGEQQPWCSCKEWDCCWSSPPSWHSPHPCLFGLQVQIMTTIAQNLPPPGDTHPIPLIAPRCYVHRRFLCNSRSQDVLILIFDLGAKLQLVFKISM